MKLPNLKNLNPAHIAIGVAAIAVLGLSTSFLKSDPPQPDETSAVVASAASSAPVHSTQPVFEVADVAERVFYMSEGSREWGSVCRLPGGGYVTADHVSRNGTPVVGPTDPVTMRSEGSDWAFLGVDPNDLDPKDFAELSPGMDVSVVAFPAVDRDGEQMPGRIYIDDNQWPFVWVELLHRDDGSHPEGAVGGVSGGCLVDENFKPIAHITHNGFSVIEGTTNTWVMVVPTRRAIEMAQGLVPTERFSLLKDDKPRPKIETGPHALRN